MKKTHRRVALIAGVGLLLISLAGTATGVIAKYIYEKKIDNPVEAKAFYFVSDLLEEPAVNGTFPAYTLRDGEQTISFRLMNHPDSLRKSEVDITYNIKVTSLDGQQTYYSTTGSISKDADPGTGTGTGTVQITTPKLNWGTYVVTATATAPYTQTLKARITLVKTDDDIRFTVNDSAGSPTLLLTVETDDYIGDLTIEWNNVLLPDNTDPKMKNAAAQSAEVTFHGPGEYTFLFFKADPSENYANTISDLFTITKTTSGVK